MSDPVHMSGFLQKKRTTTWPNIWQTRYVSLRGFELSWSKKQGGEFLGCADLKSMKLVERGIMTKRTDLAFDTYQSNKERTRSFLFRASTEEEANMWWEKLEIVQGGLPPVRITRLVAMSDNPLSSEIAKVGDRIKLHMLASEDVLPPMVTFGRKKTADVTGSGAEWWATMELELEDQQEGPLEFHVRCTPVKTRDLYEKIREDAVAHQPIGSDAYVKCVFRGPQIKRLAMNSSSVHSPKVAAAGDTLMVALETDKAVSMPRIMVGNFRCREAEQKYGQCHLAAFRTSWNMCLQIEQSDEVPDGPVMLKILDCTDEAGYALPEHSEVCGIDEGNVPEQPVELMLRPPKVLGITCESNNWLDSQSIVLNDKVIVTANFSTAVSAVKILIGGRTVAAEQAEASEGGRSKVWRAETTFDSEEMSVSGADVPTHIPVMVEGGYENQIKVQGEEKKIPIGAARPHPGMRETLSSQTPERDKVCCTLSVLAPYQGEYHSTTVGNLALWLQDTLRMSRSYEQIRSSEGERLQGLQTVTRRADPLEYELIKVLQDGVLLCHVANAICPASQQIKITTDMKKADSNDYLNNKLKAKYRENVGNFLQACAEVLGMPTQDLFQPEDLADGRGTKQVLTCLSSLGRHCYYSRSIGYAGPYLEKPHALSRDEAGMLHAVKSGDGLWGKAAGDHFSGGINVSRQSRTPSVIAGDARLRNGSEYTRVSRGASLLNQTRS